MNTPKKKNAAASAMKYVIALLLASGVIRLGTVGMAIARETGAPLAVAEMASGETSCQVDPDIEGLLEVIQQRTRQLDEREFALLTRAQDIKVAQKTIQKNLDRLVEAEENLSETLAKVDGASEDDIGKLTSVYESMKPKTAAALFEQMTPEFAAGFLGRMEPNAAAAIMSGISSDTAYAISVMLAGRNATVPKK